MLELRLTGENCNKLLPLDSTEACICSYEGTFCAASRKKVARLQAIEDPQCSWLE